MFVDACVWYSVTTLLPSTLSLLSYLSCHLKGDPMAFIRLDMWLLLLTAKLRVGLVLTSDLLLGTTATANPLGPWLLVS